MFKVNKSVIISIFLALAIFVSLDVSGAAAQGNAISGGVFGHNRQPLAELNIELLDEYGSTIQRTRTNGAGRFFFSRISSGRFTVRVLPFGTDYEEQEQAIEITNFSRTNPVTGSSSMTGATHEQRDFYLRLRKGVDPVTAGAIFVQEVPPEAKKLYETSLQQLADKKQKEAYESLKSALEIFPKYFMALDTLGKEYVEAGYYEPAAILLDIAVKVNDRNARTWHALAHALYNLKKYNEAKEAIDSSLKLNSTIPEAVLLSGVLMKLGKKYGDAEKQMLKAKELSRDKIPAVHWELALLYANHMERYDDAARELKVYMKNEKSLKDTDHIKKLITDLEAKAVKTK